MPKNNNSHNTVSVIASLTDNPRRVLVARHPYTALWSDDVGIKCRTLVVFFPPCSASTTPRLTPWIRLPPLTQRISAAGLLEELTHVKFMPWPARGWFVEAVMVTEVGGTEIRNTFWLVGYCGTKIRVTFLSSGISVGRILWDWNQNHIFEWWDFVGLKSESHSEQIAMGWNQNHILSGGILWDWNQSRSTGKQWVGLKFCPMKWTQKNHEGGYIPDAIAELCPEHGIGNNDRGTQRIIKFIKGFSTCIIHTNQKVFKYDSQSTVSVTVSTSGVVVAALVAVHLYTAPLSSGRATMPISDWAMLPMTL